MVTHISYRSILSIALACALLVRGMIPNGFMPSDGYWVEMCTAHGVVSVWSDDDQPNTSTPTCPWAGVISAIDPISLWITPLLNLSHATPMVRMAQSFSSNARWLLPLWRAPPVVS